MVISFSVLQLNEIVVVDLFAYSFRSGEVHRSVFHRSDFACSHKGAVYWGIVVCVHIQYIVGWSFWRITSQVEVRVVGHIDDRLFIGSCAIFDVDSVVFSQFVSHFSCHITREVFVSVRWDKCQFQRCRINQISFINFVLPTFRTSVQAVAEIVLRQLDRVTVQCETSLVDTVCIASDRSTEVAGYINIVSNAVKT